MKAGSQSSRIEIQLAPACRPVPLIIGLDCGEGDEHKPHLTIRLDLSNGQHPSGKPGLLLCIGARMALEENLEGEQVLLILN